MRKILCVTAVAFSLACLMPAPAVLAAEGGALEFVNIHRVGLGANYWKTVDNIDVEDIHETGFSYLLSYQYVPIRYVKVEADLEYFPRLAEGGKAA